MGVNDELRAVPATHVVHGGTQDVPKDKWLPFEWEEPRLGRCVHGEIVVMREFGTSGTLMAGFWRSHANTPGANKDGTHTVIYSSPLTRAEQLVFFMLCNGLSNKRIADRLAISENTVRFHLKKLYAKFGVRSRTHAVAIGSGAMHERSASA